MSNNPTKYYGKYRGTVLNNIDALQTGRLLVQVPDVFGVGTSSWALACVPLAGKQMGAWFVPQIGAGVWVEFEKGDPDYPIWSGCFWGSAAEPPALALAGLPASPSIVLQTAGQNTVMLSDAAGALLSTMPGFILHVGATVTCSHAGQATPATNVPRVLVSGQPVIVAGTSYVVAGCTLPPPTAANGPCVSGQFTTPATRVQAGGVPVLINTNPSVCAPTGTPLIPSVVQSRVVAM